MAGKIKTKYIQKQVIENKLLAALNEEGTTAILATELDLRDFHAALCGYDIGVREGNVISIEAFNERKRLLADGIKQLYEGAFGKPL